MPFGLCNAPATFQRLMSTALDGLIPKVAGAFIDDVISFSPTFTGQLANMRSVLTRLRSAGLKVKPKKCEIISKSVAYLGHVFSADGVSPDTAKFSAVQTWPTPKSSTDIRRFVGILLPSVHSKILRDCESSSCTHQEEGSIHLVTRMSSRI